MIPHLLCQHSLTCLFSKDMDPFVKSLRNQFLSLFLRLCYFFLFVPNFPFFCYSLHFYHPLSFFFFLLFLFLLFFPLLLFFLSPSVSTTLTSLDLVFTVYHTSLGISSSSPLLSSSQFQNYGKQAMTFPKLYSTFDYQSH